ncbi:murein biosynthesis integral membrane protein MurJ [Patescibacteria group bacterium]|nr:murein biosynthesis integral membrane protein MurJ [Patescibacteria group bacterium]
MSPNQLINKISLKKQDTILSASLILSITFAFSALLGFLRNRFLLSRFFSCCADQLDAYNAAFHLPDLVFKLLVTGALSASFIPVFSKYLYKDKKTAYKIATTIINVLLIALFFLLLIILIFTQPFSKLIAPGFNEQQLLLMSSFTRVLLIAQIFFLFSNFLTGIIQAHQIFLIPAISPIFYNLSIIFGILFVAPVWGIQGVCFSVVLGAFLHLLIQIPLAKKLGFKYSFFIDTRLPGFRKILKLMAPRAISLGLTEIENTFTLLWSSLLVPGSFSLLNIAFQLVFFPTRIFGSTISQASLPILSKNIARNKLKTFRKTVINTIIQSLFLVLPISTLMLVHRVAIIRLIFGARQFPWSATLLTAKTLAFLIPTIASQAIAQILTRSFYAMHNTKTPLHVSLVSVVFNLLTNFYFIKFTNLGILGLAISSSISGFIQFLGLFYFFYLQVKNINLVQISKRIFKIIFASVIMGASIWFGMKFLDLFILDTSRTLNLTALFLSTSFLGFLIYYFTCNLFNIKESKDLGKFFKFQLKHKKFNQLTEIVK